MRKKLSFLTAIALLLWCSAYAQSSACPSNINFENGTLNGWECFTGFAPGTSFTLSGPVANRHTIMSGAGVDPVGLFPVVAPGGGNFSVKLGNNSTGGEAERIRYKVRIPSGFNNLSLLYNYAVVFEDPGHAAANQPRFVVRAYDSSTNANVPCLPQPYVAGSGLPGFFTSGIVRYQPWTTRTLNLSGMGGKTVYVEFTTSDCTLGGHYGYAYIDVQCGLFQITNGYCPGATSAILTAPPGFQSYVWSDSVITNIVGTGATITVPAPSDTTTFFVILTPYSGYGCQDTLQTVIAPAIAPVAKFGLPDSFCAGSPVIFTDSSISSTAGTFINQWYWNFGNPSSGVNNTSTLQNPTHIYNTAGTYTVYLIVHSNVSCVSDTVFHTLVITPSITVNAGPDTLICSGSSANLHASVFPINPLPGTVYTYSWTPSSTLSCSNCLNPVATPTATTTYYFTTNYYPNTCNKTDSVIVTVATPLPPLSITATPSNICPGATSQLTASFTPLNCGPTSAVNTSSVTVNTVGTASGTTVYPLTSYWHDGRTQMLFLKTELNAAGITGGTIKALALYVSSKGSTIPFSGFTIKIGCTALSTLTTVQSGLSTVYGPVSYTSVAGSWNTFNLSTQYEWNNASNLIVEICYDNSSYTNYDYVNSTTTAFTSTIYTYGDGYVGCTMTPSSTSTSRPQLKFSYSAATAPPVTYSWSPSVGLSNSTISNPVATPSVTTTYTVTASSGICANTNSAVTVNVSNLMVNAGTDVTICPTASTQLNATASGSSPITGYSWTPATGLSATNIANPVASPAVTTTYIVTATNAALCSRSDTVVVTVSPPFTLAASSNNVSCNGGNNGMAWVVPNPNSAGYSYSWNTTPAQLNDTAFNLMAGTYIVTVSNAASCSKTATVNITQPNVLSNVTASVITNVSCFGGTNGSVTVTNPVGGTPPYSYSWNSTPIQTTQTASGLSAGAYTITVTDSKGCIKTSTATVTQPTPLANVAASVVTNVNCFGGNNGSVTVSIPTGGTTPYSYSWNTTPVQTTQTLSSLLAGSYTVTVTDANGCSLTSTATITQPPVLSNVTASVVTNVACFGGNNGSVTVTTPTGGTAPYSYSWNSTPVQTTQTATGLPAGTFTVTVTDAHGCIKTSTATITQPAVLANVTTSVVTNVSCFGGNNGSATLTTPSGGTSPYNYSWNSTPIQTAQTATGLVAGLYTVTVTDAHGCSLTSTATVTQPSVLANVTASVVNNVACFGGNNGSVTVTTPTGGTSPYNYSWNSTPSQTTQTATGLIAGSYTVTVTDAHGCTLSSTTSVTQPPVLANVTASVVTQVVCFGGNNGSVTVTTPTGGTAPYAYSWNSTPVQTTQTAIGLPAGTFTVTVTDAHGCSLTSGATITQPTVLSNVTASVVTNITCFGGNNGSVTVTAPSGGTAPYSYSWSTTPVQTSQTATNLPAGVYTVTVTDANGCTKTSTATITQPPVLSNVTASVVSNVACFGGNNGSVTVTTPTGGTSPYNYSWNSTPSQTTQTATGLIAGSYTVTVTDAHGCMLSSIATITQPTVLANVTASVVNNVSCFGGNNGSVTVTTPSGGTTPYSYSWNSLPAQTTQSATGLQAGTYTVTVTDANGCSLTSTATVTQPTALGNLTASVIGNVNCAGGNTGSVTVTNPSGGTAPYSYSWNSIPVQTTQTATGLPAGTFTVTVTDAHGCTKTSSATITQPSGLSNVIASVVTNINCFGGNNGSVTVTNPIGGTLPYAYSWNSTPTQTTQTATGLIAGTYTVTVTDANGCYLTSTAIITQPALLSNASASVVNNVACFGGNNGSVSVTTPNGGTPPYSYSWNSTPIQTTQTATGLAAGTYTVTVTDANNCPSLSSAATISQPLALSNVQAITLVQINCFGNTNGMAAVTSPSGGTAPYTYSWNSMPVQTNDTAVNLSAGTYTVIVTDANGCTLSSNTTVTQPPAMGNVIASVVNPVSCFGLSNGAATVTAPSGGLPPYSFLWNSTPVQTNDTAFGLPAGNYIIQVTDANGCSLSDTVAVTQPTALSPITATVINQVSCFGFSNANLTVSAPIGGTPPYSFTWNTTPVQLNDTAFNLPVGMYSITVSDANNCMQTDSVAVTQPLPLANAIATTLTNVSCFGGNNGSIMVSTPNGGTLPYSFSWNTSPIQTNDTVLNLPAGNYTVTVSDANNCPALLDSTIVTQPTAITNVSAFVINNVSCFGFSDANIAVTNPSGGTAPYTFAWNTIPAQNNDTAFSVMAGNFTITVTDANGCTLSDNTTVTQPPALGNVLASTLSNVTCNGGSNGVIMVSAPTGGTSPYFISWNTTPSQYNDTLSNMPAGSYTVTVIDSQGCQLSSSTSITQPPPITNVIASTINNVTCFGFSNGTVTVTNPQGGTLPYSFSWNSSPIQVNDTAFNLPAGTYTVSVTDANNCPAPSATTIVTQPTALGNVNAVTLDQVTCFGYSNGSVMVTWPTGGTPPYMFNWNTTPVQTNDTLFSMPAGTYAVTVTDSQGCTLSDSTVVTQPSPINNVNATVINHVSCFGFSDASITVSNPTGGTPGYTFSWNTSPIQNSQTVSNLPIGTYTVTVTDANNCSITSTTTVTQPTPLANVQASLVTDASCFGFSNGSLTCSNPSGGTPPYAYSWSSIPTQNSQTATNLAAGAYTVTVTDSHGCILTSSDTIHEPQPLGNVLASTINHVSCFGGNNGTVTVSLPTGGTQPYTYSWNSTPNQSTATAINLPVGNYTVTVSDAHNCPPLSSSTPVTQPSPLTNVNASVINHVSCFGFNDANIMVSHPTGGTVPYSYSWNTIPPQTNDTATNLIAGVYIITVTDSFSCTKTDTVTVTQPTVLTNVTASAVNHVSCYGFSDANITVTNPAGGTAPYSYSWNTTPVQTSMSVANIPAGTYTVTVTDSHLCVLASTITVTQPSALANVTASTVQNVSCFGGVDGIISVTTPTGGTQPYSYSWNTVPVQNFQTINNVAIGTYTVTVNDAHQCNLVSSTQVTQPTQLTNVVANPLHAISCFGNSDGSVMVSNPSGGTAPYSYSWNSTPVQTNDTANNLASGTYTVTVTDNKGCAASSTTLLIEPPLLIPPYTSSTNALCGSATGTVTCYQPIGGTPPYAYLWNTSPPQNSQVANNLVAGSYTVTITDAYNCATSAMATVIKVGGIDTLIVHGNNISCFGGSDGWVQCDTPTTGSAPYAYVWNTTPNQYSPVAVGLGPGFYKVNVTDVYGCARTSPDIYISQPPKIILQAINTKDATCYDAANGSASILGAQGGIPPYTYLWESNPVQYGQQANNLKPGFYTIVVTDNKGCSSMDGFEIKSEPVPIANAGPDATISVGDTWTLNGNLSYGVNTNTVYQWQTVHGFPSGNEVSTQVSPKVTMPYILTIYNSDSSCKTSDTVVVVVKECAEIFMPNAFTPNGDGVDDQFQMVNPYDIERLESFYIYNRWGQRMYSGTDKNKGWDGMFNGEKQEYGTYMYTIDVVCFGGHHILKSGDLTLIR